MNLYIEIENGSTKNHPAFEDNLLQAFGMIPPNWERFTRVERPALNVYQVLESEEPTYSKVDGVWSDVWALRDMTAEEKAQKQQSVKNVWAAQANLENWAAWSFDEATCSYIPPTPRPDDGKQYFWQGTTSSWVELPQYPDDEKKYKLDFASATWVEVTT